MDIFEKDAKIEQLDIERIYYKSKFERLQKNVQAFYDGKITKQELISRAIELSEVPLGNKLFALY